MTFSFYGLGQCLVITCAGCNDILVFAVILDILCGLYGPYVMDLIQ